MTVFVDGIEQYTWKVSTGRPEYATPSGTYAPTSMNEMWYSKQWDNSPMPHAIFFMKDGHAIHGTHEVKNLGKAASHGCVRLSPENAAILYDLVEKNGMQNTQVVLSGETPGGEYKGVATARPQYQYPQYPYGLMAGGRPSRRLGTIPARKPRFSRISSRADADCSSGGSSRIRAIMPPARPTLLPARLRLLDPVRHVRSTAAERVAHREL